MEHAQYIEVLLLKENPLSLKILCDQPLLLLYGLGLAVYLLEDHTDELKLAVSQGLHLRKTLCKCGFAPDRGFKAREESLRVLELLLLKLSLDLLWVIELERVWHELECLVGLGY